MLQLKTYRTFLSLLQSSQRESVNLKPSAPEGLIADTNTEKGPEQTIVLKSVVDPRSVFIAIQACKKLNGAICNCGSIKFLPKDF